MLGYDRHMLAALLWLCAFHPSAWAGCEAPNALTVWKSPRVSRFSEPQRETALRLLRQAVPAGLPIETAIDLVFYRDERDEGDRMQTAGFYLGNDRSLVIEVGRQHRGRGSPEEVRVFDVRATSPEEQEVIAYARRIALCSGERLVPTLIKREEPGSPGAELATAPAPGGRVFSVDYSVGWDAGCWHGGFGRFDVSLPSLELSNAVHAD